MKHLPFIITTAVVLFITACASPDLEYNEDYYALNIPNDNEMIFDVYAEISPEGKISESDTLWMEIDLKQSLFTDKISGQGVAVPLKETRFICQFKVSDLIETTPPQYNMIVKSGKLIDKLPELVTVAFGYPEEETNLKVGFIFNEIGRYAINFINYPNPEEETQLNDPCIDDCVNYWYDMGFYYDENMDDFEYKAFIEYHFKIPNRENVYDNSDFSKNSIYDDAVYTFIVK